MHSFARQQIVLLSARPQEDFGYAQYEIFANGEFTNHIALIDGTFWSSGTKNESKIPHPPIEQTLEMLGYKQKGDPDIFFFHLNHTNPVYDQWSEQHTQVVEMGWKVAKQGMRFSI